MKTVKQFKMFFLKWWALNQTQDQTNPTGLTSVYGKEKDTLLSGKAERKN